MIVESRYPWDEQITVTVTGTSAEPWTLSLRVPAWCADMRLTINGTPTPARAQIQNGYLQLNRSWHTGDEVLLTLAMPARLVAAHPRVDATRGAAALARGPLVYCLEHADMPAELGLFEDLELDPGSPAAIAFHSNGLAPVTMRVKAVVRAAHDVSLYQDLRRATTKTATTATVTAIPYFLWANRKPGPMRVWIPLAAQWE